jgi:fibrillarin-like pre-rRNA processing protein
MERINPMRGLKGIYTDNRRRLYTKSLGGKFSVYGERLIKQKDGVYREWNPERSKLGAAIKCNISQIGIKPDSKVLYLGAASGTTVSHVADIVGENGFVYALDSAPIPLRQLFKVVNRWPNVAPLLFDAGKPEDYAHLVEEVDVVFQDIAQRAQVRIFLDNCDKFLKQGGFGLLSLKAKSIDVTRKAKGIFVEVERMLAQRSTIVDKRVLEPFEKDHCLFMIKKK